MISTLHLSSLFNVSIAEAMKLAMTEGELSGESIRNAMYKRKLKQRTEGVCLPSTGKMMIMRANKLLTW